MNVKIKLLGELKRQLQLEIEARDLYSKFLKNSDEKKANLVVRKIEKDEEEHIEVVTRMIKIVEGYKEPLKEKVTKKDVANKKETSGMNKKIKDANSILFLSSVEVYIFKIKQIVKENIKNADKKNLVYVSYNKIPKYTKKIFEEYGINNDKILFINCVGSSEPGDINIKPEELTKLSIVINNAVEEMKNSLVIIDTISAFSLYNNLNTISKFVASMNNHARSKGYTIMWIALKDEAEKDLNAKLASFCDTVVHA